MKEINVENEYLKLKIEKLEIENYYLRKYKSIYPDGRVGRYLSIYEPEIIEAKGIPKTQLDVLVDVRSETPDPFSHHIIVKCYSSDKKKIIGYQYWTDRLDLVPRWEAIQMAEEFHKNMVHSMAQFLFKEEDQT
jgi:hypothetical protein